jgi:dipeptidyl aminopeptidase/acylaminoacyl peptidase
MGASRRRHPNVFLVLAALISAVLASAGTARAQDDAGEWTFDDILFSESAGSYQISPDGRWVVWVKSTMDKDRGRSVSNLYLSSLTSDVEIQLTRGSYSHSSPRWTPAGDLISFMSSRPLPDKQGDAASSQLWLINPAGGEPWPLTSFERGISSYDWKDDETIIFSAQEDPTLYESDRQRGLDPQLRALTGRDARCGRPQPQPLLWVRRAGTTGNLPVESRDRCGPGDLRRVKGYSGQRAVGEGR